MFPTKRRPHFGHLHMKTSLRVGRPSCLSLARRPGKMPRMTVDDRYELGRARFLEVHDDKALRAVEGLGDLGRSIVEFVYGDVYSREKLSTREREIAAVAALIALGRSSQLPQHLRASLKAGITPDELREVILQTAVIAGFPELDERSVDAEDDSGGTRSGIRSIVARNVGAASSESRVGHRG